MKEIYLLLDNIRSLYNVGAIFRTADASRVSKIYLSGISGVEKFGTEVRLHPKLHKTALAGIEVPWEYVDEPLLKLKELKKQGVQLVSLEITEKSLDFRKAEYKFPLCLVVGHETLGVNDEINQMADVVIKIPMLGKGTSMNVSVATGIALYEIIK